MTHNSPDAMPRHGRLAGIDYGTVRLGIAVCDPEQAIASPLSVLRRKDREGEARFFRSLAGEQRLVGFVVGLPVHTDGRESQKSVEARDYGSWLAQTCELPVAYHDERFTSQEAEELLQQAGLTSRRRKQRRDMLAAQLLLQAYLESSRGQDEPGAL